MIRLSASRSPEIKVYMYIYIIFFLVKNLLIEFPKNQFNDFVIPLNNNNNCIGLLSNYKCLFI